MEAVGFAMKSSSPWYPDSHAFVLFFALLMKTTERLHEIYFTFKSCFINADIVKAVIKLFATPIILILAKIILYALLHKL